MHLDLLQHQCIYLFCHLQQKLNVQQFQAYIYIHLRILKDVLIEDVLVIIIISFVRDTWGFKTAEKKCIAIIITILFLKLVKLPTVFCDASAILDTPCLVRRLWQDLFDKIPPAKCNKNVPRTKEFFKKQIQIIEM